MATTLVRLIVALALVVVPCAASVGDVYGGAINERRAVTAVRSAVTVVQTAAARAKSAGLRLLWPEPTSTGWPLPPDGTSLPVVPDASRDITRVEFERRPGRAPPRA